MKFEEITFEEWTYPPTISKKTGLTRKPFDYIHIINIESDLFDHPVIMTSDLHQHAMEVFERLSKTIDLSRFVVLTAGDMAGKNYFGSNGDPTPVYEFIADKSKALYFVQGNHDLPAKKNRHLSLKNEDDTKCMIPDGETVYTIIGTISGINGIITRSYKAKLYKFLPNDYFDLAEQILSNNKPYIFMTHDTPAIPIPPDPTGRIALNGKERLFDLVDKYKPKVHIYGHCHHRTFTHHIRGVNYINVDGRVLIINPIKE